MNRDIEFRGKDEKNGKWRYGFLTSPGVIGVIYEEEDGMETGDLYGVDPETLGEYSGLKEGNWTVYAKKTKTKDEVKKIFEGDIIRCDLDVDPDGRQGIIGKVFFRDGMFRFGSEVHSRELSDCYNRIIIGNIHDNSELFE
jgi:hypothetical protein